MNRLTELREIVAYLQTELRSLHTAAEDRSFTDDETARFNEGVFVRDAAIAEGIELEARVAQVAASIDAGDVERITPAGPQIIVRNDPFDTSDLRMNAPASEVRARALTAIESVEHLDDNSRERATFLLERKDNGRGALARHILATGTDLYRSGFQKIVGGADYSVTPDEARAIDEARAASLTDGAGGFAVPFTLDPTIIDTGAGSANAFRQVARVEPIVTDNWNGVSSAGVTAGYAAEVAEVGDDAPTLVQPTVPVHRADAFVPFSFEIGGDWVSIESDLRAMIQVGKDDLESEKFVTGTGSGQPTGIQTALDGTASELAPATAEVFAYNDIYAVDAALPAKYRQSGRASWMATHDSWVQIRKLAAALGSAQGEWHNTGGGLPPTFQGYNALEASGLDTISGINAAATADHFVLLLGDFQNYVIAERVGMSVELVPHLFATANNRPSGQRGFLAWWRNGADSVNDAAFRVLSIPTAA